MPSVYCYVTTTLSDANTVDSQFMSDLNTSGITTSGWSRYTVPMEDGRGNYALPVPDAFKTVLENGMSAEQLARCQNVDMVTSDFFTGYKAQLVQDEEANYDHGCVAVTTSTTGALVSGTSNSNEMPFNGFYKYSMSAQLLTQSEIGAAKQITGLQVQMSFNESDGWSQRDQKVYLMHTTADEFPTSFGGLYLTNVNQSDKTLVIDGDVYIPPHISNYWEDIDFDSGKTFCYNGVDNLIILWENRWGSFMSGYPYFERRSNSSDDKMMIYDRGDETQYDNLTPIRTSYRYNIKLKY